VPAVVDAHGSDVKKAKQAVDNGRSGNRNGVSKKDAMEKANVEQVETEETRQIFFNFYQKLIIL
jgi:hypothetical protein